MIVYDAQRRPVELGESVGHGGEATVYRMIGQTERLAKIYEPAPRPNYSGKLGWMVTYPPDNPTERLNHASLAWPGGLLYDSRRQLKGYWMPYIQRAIPILDVFIPRRRVEILPQFDRRYLLRTARNLAAALSALHSSGYVAGDLNESNVLVTPTALVTLIDTDSFQVREERMGSLVMHPCPVGKPEYTPPELQGQQLGEIVRLPDHDAFGLAVLIFQLLMEGSHPFRAQWLGAGEPPPLEARIANGVYPYDDTPAHPVRPPKNALGIETLHPWLVELFRRCFVDGHRDPRWRPGPELWMRTLHEAEQAQVCCAEGHYYSSHLTGCPYCALAQARVQKQLAPRADARKTAWSQRVRQTQAGTAQTGAGRVRTPGRRAPAGTARGTAAPRAATAGSGAASSAASSSAAASASGARVPPYWNIFFGQKSQSTNPFANWPGAFTAPVNSPFPGVHFSTGSGGAAAYGFPGVSGSGVLGSRPFIPPGSLQNWARVRAYKSLSIGGMQGALAGALPGALVGLANWTAGQEVAWALLFTLGGIAGGLVRGWNPGHKLATLIDRFIGWKSFWEAFGLIGGAIGGVALGLVFAWAIIPIFLGLILGSQVGLYLGRKLHQLGSLMGWERIWGGLSAASFGAMGFGVTQVLGAAGVNILGAYLNTQVLPVAESGSMMWALAWLLCGAAMGALGGALVGILSDVVGRFTGLVD
jgi:hypothetical protein